MPWLTWTTGSPIRTSDKSRSMPSTLLRRPRSLRLTSLVYQTYRVGWQAIPMILVVASAVQALVGAGAYAVGMLAKHGVWNEPITGLILAAADSCPEPGRSPAARSAPARPLAPASRASAFAHIDATPAPEAAISSISSKETTGSLRAPGTMRGSAEKTPATSV